MPPMLVLQGGRIDNEFQLRSGRNLIGRSASSCQILLSHDAVSRRHALVDATDEGSFIEDLKSHNGTLVNGQRLAPGPAGRRQLCDGDLIEINGFRLTFYGEDPTSSDVLLIADSCEGSSHRIVASVDVDSNVDETLEYPTAKLRALLRVIDDLAEAIDLREVPKRALESMLASFEQAQSGFVLLAEPGSGELRTATALHRDGATRRIRMSRTIVDNVVRRKSALLTTDATRDQRFAESPSVLQMSLRSMMCAPLLNRLGGVMGVVQLDASDSGQQFSHADLEVMAGIGRHVATVIENARLHDQAMSAQRTRYERQFRDLVEGSIQGILIHRNFQPLFVNEAWARFHNHTASEIYLLATVAPLVHDDDFPAVRAHLERLAHGETTPVSIEYQGVRKDGSVVWFENIMTRVEWDGLPAIQSTIIDVTDRRRAHEELERRVEQRTADLSAANKQLHAEIQERILAEAKLRRSESLYQSLVETIPLGVARKDLDGRYTFANEALCSTVGMSLEAILGQSDFAVFPASLADKFQRDDQQAIEAGVAVEFVERLDLPDQPTRYTHTIRSPIRDDDGQIGGVQLIISDITLLRQTEQELILYSAELERSNRELSQFASVVSHDLTAPLRAISSYGQLLQRRYRGRLDATADEILGYVVGGADRMRTLIHDLQAYASVTTRAKPLRPTDLNLVVRDAVSNLQAEIKDSGGQVNWDPLPTVSADGTQLLQVFQNLIGNAIKYHGSEPPRITIRAEQQEHEWLLAVSDNGIGIEPRNHARIFIMHQRLHTAKEYPGTGLGLALCQRIIERHGGHVRVESQLGAGSTFQFTLPVRQAALVTPRRAN